MCFSGPSVSLWLSSQLIWPVYMGALRHTGRLIGAESDPLLSTGLWGIRLSHFDSPAALNCAVNLDAALSSLTYWSPESVLRVPSPTNLLLCPPSSPHNLSICIDKLLFVLLPESQISVLFNLYTVTCRYSSGQLMKGTVFSLFKGNHV